jgi:transposase InsO family protein
MHTWRQHKNARLTPLVRQEMVQRINKGGVTKTDASRQYGIHRNTVAKWVREVDEIGNWLCLDKDSCPEKFRIQRGLKRLDEVEKKINKRLNRDRMRYVKDHPGELVHIDTKKLPSIEGDTDKSKQYLYVAVDDATRYLYAAIMSDKTDETAGEFMEEVLVTSPFIIDAVMTDNGREYRGKIEQGHTFETILEREHIKHVYTKIKTPQTNGKAERMMRTIMSWHRMIQFTSRDERSYRLSDFVEWYNSKKGHSSLKGEVPFAFLVKHLKLCEKCTQRWQS